MIRKLEARDLPRIRELQGDHVWEFGSDFECGYVFVDVNDSPVLVAGTWKRAEGHALIDPSWGTPGARMMALQEAHDAMERHLYAVGYREVLTFFPQVEAFCRRMQRLGWKQIQQIVWGREVRNG